MLQWVSINKRLGNEVRLGNFVLNFFRCNIFSLWKLKYIFLSVDNSQNTLLSIYLTDITSVNPAFSINSLLGHLWLSVVSLEYSVTSVKNFTAWLWLSMLINIIRGIVHIWYINKFDFKSGEWGSDMTGLGIQSPRNSNCCCTLSLTIAFLNLYTESNFKEVQYLLGNRGWTSNHSSDSASEDFSKFIEYQSIIKSIICLGRWVKGW